MKKMILAEVHRFRQMVRAQPVQAQGMPGSQQQNVPIPDHYDPRAPEDPRPHEAFSGQYAMGALEQELQGGLDAKMQQ